MAEVREQLRITMYDDKSRDVKHIKYGGDGMLAEERTGQLREGTLGDTDLRREFDALAEKESINEGGPAVAAAADYDLSTPEGRALAAQAKRDRARVEMQILATDERGQSRVLATQEDLGAKGGPVASGDPNVSDAARKREDGAAEPAIAAADINQPAQPIRNAPRGEAVVQSQGAPLVETEENEDPIDNRAKGGPVAKAEEKPTEKFSEADPEKGNFGASDNPADAPGAKEAGKVELKANQPGSQKPGTKK